MAILGMLEDADRFVEPIGREEHGRISPGEADEPGRIYHRLRGRVNELASFDGDGFGGVDVVEDEIRVRHLKLAIPAEITVDQMLHVKRAIDYAQSVDVDLIVTRIK